MNRYFAWWASIVLALLSAALALHWPGWWWGAGVFGVLALVGAADVLQRTSTLRRNYPLLAHFRYGLESIGPEMRQYFIEGDTAEVPFSRLQRALVYQRSKSVSDVRPFAPSSTSTRPTSNGSTTRWRRWKSNRTIFASSSASAARSRTRPACSTFRR